MLFSRSIDVSGVGLGEVYKDKYSKFSLSCLFLFFLLLRIEQNQIREIIELDFVFCFFEGKNSIPILFVSL
jgi:hypothetical protein